MKRKLILLFVGLLHIAPSASAQQHTPDEYANKSLQDEICASKKRTEELELRLKTNLQKKITLEYEADLKTYQDETAKFQKELADKISQLNYEYLLKINKLALVFKAKYEIPIQNNIPQLCK
jgi:Skp family chaperone for outer membrane proteins